MTRIFWTDDSKMKGARHPHRFSEVDLRILAGDGGEPIDEVRSTKEIAEFAALAKSGEHLQDEQHKGLSVSDLRELAAKATGAHAGLWERYEPIVTEVRAKQIRIWRVEKHCTWRRIAELCHRFFDDAHWQPESNQLAGMVMCEAAAHHFGEHYMEAPWN